MNWKWPATKANDMSPWYAIVRRLVFLPLVLVGVGIAAFGCLCAWGKKDAHRFIMDTLR
jgi:hypothetical protein